MKLLEKNKKYLWGLGLRKGFLDMTREAQSIEGGKEINKLLFKQTPL